MKKQFFPLALGLVAAIAAPAKAATDNQPAEFDNPVGQVASVNAADSGKTAVPERAIAASTVHGSSSATDGTQADMPVAQDSAPTAGSNASGILSFEPPGATSIAIASAALPDGAIAVESSAPNAKAEPSKPSEITAASPGGEKLFQGGSQSIVARVVGAAEGTRNPDGSPTEIFEGHVDPGNGVWNRGTFSYQFGNEENLSTEEADRRQMAKIKRIYESVMLAKAAKQGVTPLTLAEELNGIDVINQAPLAITEEGGYIERLAEAKTKKGLTGAEAILDARVWSFWDPQRNGWDAPGLRAYDDMGKEASIRHDQQRRMGMIDQALVAYQQQHGAIAQNSAAPQQPQPMAALPSSANQVSPDAVANAIIFQTSKPVRTNGSKFAS